MRSGFSLNIRDQTFPFMFLEVELSFVAMVLLPQKYEAEIIQNQQSAVYLFLHSSNLTTSLIVDLSNFPLLNLPVSLTLINERLQCEVRLSKCRKQFTPSDGLVVDCEDFFVHVNDGGHLRSDIVICVVETAKEATADWHIESLVKVLCCELLFNLKQIVFIYKNASCEFGELLERNS